MNGDDALALVLGGGGARGAYQAGVLRGLARHFPDLRFPVMTGISAGAVNTLGVASHDGTLADAADALIALWMDLTPQRVYDVRPRALAANLARWAGRLLSGGVQTGAEPMRGMMNTDPLRRFLTDALSPNPDGSLPGIARNLARGTLHAVALSATSYTSGRSMTWVQGRDITLWQRPQRRSENAALTVEHVMASSALPILFPAVRVGGEWYGDGGIRLTAPLSPALHLGATKILTVSTKHHHPDEPLRAPAAYPPPARVLGVLYGAVFLDVIDEDILRLQLMNRMLAGCAPAERGGMRIVDILVIRPSRDLRALAQDLEPRLPATFRYLMRGLGTRQTGGNDVLSLVLFQPEYVSRLVELGERDAHAQAEHVAAFLDGRTARGARG